MKRVLLIAAGLFVALLLLVAVALPAFVDVDHYRPAIEEALRSATGRQVTLGDLRFRLLPRPTLAAAGLSIGEDPRFGAEPFLEAERLEVSVALLPLFRGTVAAGSLRIVSPDLRLLRDADRRWSLASLMGGPKPGGTARGPGAAAGPTGGEPESASVGGEEAEGSARANRVSLSVERLILTGGTVTFVDRAFIRGQTLTSEARDIELEVTDLSPETPIGFDLAFVLADSGKATLQGRIGPVPPSGSSKPLPMEARLRLDGFRGGAAAPYLRALSGLGIHGGSMDLDLNLSGEVPGALSAKGQATLNDLSVEPLAGGGPPVAIDGTVALEGVFSEEEMRLTRCRISRGGSTVSLAGSLSGLRSGPVIEARVETERVAFEDVLPVFEIIGPILPPGLTGEGEISLEASVKGPLRRPEGVRVEGRATIAGFAYADASLRKPITGIEGRITFRGDRAEIDGFTASLGRSRVNGECSISRFGRPVIEASLASPLIDLDEILSLLKTATPVATVAERNPATGPGESGSDVRRWEHALRRSSTGHGGAVIHAASGPTPASPASSLLGDVTIRGRLDVERMKVLNLNLSAIRAGFSMEKGLARLSDVALSLYEGGLTGDASAGFSETGPPFTLKASLRDVDFNAMAADFSPEMAGLLHGTLEASLDVHGKGLSRPDLRRQLRGTGRLALRDGRLTSFGVLKLIAKALEAAGGRGIGEDETPFTALTGTFVIANGRARTEDLLLDSPDVRLKGEGDVLLDLGLELDVSARISKEVSDDMVAQTPNLRYLQNDKGKLVVDLALGGTLMKPSVRIDPETLRRAARKAAKEEVREKGKDILDKLLKKKN